MEIAMVDYWTIKSYDFQCSLVNILFYEISLLQGFKVYRH